MAIETISANNTDYSISTDARMAFEDLDFVGTVTGNVIPTDFGVESDRGSGVLTFEYSPQTRGVLCYLSKNPSVSLFLPGGGTITGVSANVVDTGSVVCEIPTAVGENGVAETCWLSNTGYGTFFSVSAELVGGGRLEYAAGGFGNNYPAVGTFHCGHGRIMAVPTKVNKSSGEYVFQPLTGDYLFIPNVESFPGMVNQTTKSEIGYVRSSAGSVSPAISGGGSFFAANENFTTVDSNYIYYAFGVYNTSGIMVCSYPVENAICYKPGDDYAYVRANCSVYAFPSTGDVYPLITAARADIYENGEYTTGNCASIANLVASAESCVAGSGEGESWCSLYKSSGGSADFVSSPFYFGSGCGIKVGWQGQLTENDLFGCVGLMTPIVTTEYGNGIFCPLCGPGIGAPVSSLLVEATFCPRIAYTPVRVVEDGDSSAVAGLDGASSSFIGWNEYGWDVDDYRMPTRVVRGEYRPNFISRVFDVDDFGVTVTISGYDENIPVDEAVSFANPFSATGFRISRSFGEDVSAVNSVTYSSGGGEGGVEVVSLVRRRYDFVAANEDEPNGNYSFAGEAAPGFEAVGYMPHMTASGVQMVASSIPRNVEYVGPESGVFFDRKYASIEWEDVPVGEETLERFFAVPTSVEMGNLVFSTDEISLEFSPGNIRFVRPVGDGFDGEEFSLAFTTGDELPDDLVDIFSPFMTTTEGRVYISPSGMWDVSFEDGTPVNLSGSLFTNPETSEVEEDCTYYWHPVDTIETVGISAVASATDDWGAYESEDRIDQCASVTVNWSYSDDNGEHTLPMSKVGHLVSANGDLMVYAMGSDDENYRYVASGSGVRIPGGEYTAENIFVIPVAANGDDASVTAKVVVSGCDGYDDDVSWETDEFVARPFYLPSAVRVHVDRANYSFHGLDYLYAMSALNYEDGKDEPSIPHRLHEYRWEISGVTTKNMESWGLDDDDGGVMLIGNGTAMGPTAVSAMVIPSGTDNLTLAGNWVAAVRVSLVRDDEVLEYNGKPLVSEWETIQNICRFTDFDWCVDCSAGDNAERFRGNMLYFSDNDANLTFSASVRRGLAVPVTVTSSFPISTVVGEAPVPGVDYPLTFSVVASDDTYAPAEWGTQTSVAISVGMVGRYVPELNYIDKVHISAFPELAFSSGTADFYYNKPGETGEPSAFGNFEIVDTGHPGVFYLFAQANELPVSVERVSTNCVVCSGDEEVYLVDTSVLYTSGTGEAVGFGQCYRWAPDNFTPYGLYTMRFGVDFSRGSSSADTLTYAFEDELARSSEFVSSMDLSGVVRPRKLYVGTSSYKDLSLSSLCSPEMTLEPFGPARLGFADFASAWYSANAVDVIFPVGGIVGDCIPEDSADDPDNRIVVRGIGDAGGGKPLEVVWEADYFECTVESSDGWSYRGFVPGEGRVCGLRPTEYVTTLGVVRGTDPEFTVRSQKPTDVWMSAAPVNSPDNVFSDWFVTRISPPVVETATLHGADAVSFVPEAYVMSVVSGLEVLWRNMTNPGFYDGYLVKAYGSDRVSVLTGDSDYSMSGFGGEGFCRFSASGLLDVSGVGGDTRTKRIATVFDAPYMLYVGEYDSEISPPYRSPMSNNIVLDYGEDAVMVGPNEFITNELLNSKMDMLQHDLEQVMKSAKVFANSPYTYVGYLGRGYTRGGSLALHDMWVDLGGGGEHDITSAAETIKESPISGARSFCVNASQSIAYFCDYDVPDRYVVCSLGRIPVLTSGDYSDVYSEEGFARPRIRSIRMDNEGRTYFVVPDVNRVVCYSRYNDDGNGNVRFLYDWGGYGGPGAKLKFNNPICLAIDEGTGEYGQSLYVLDAGNDCVKKYNLSGVWRGTFRYSLGRGEAAVWLDVDIKGRMHVLTNLRDIILDSSGSVVGEYALDGSNPVCVFRNRKNDFVYIMYPRDIVKITGDGDFLCRCTDSEEWKDVGSVDGIPEFGGDMRFGYADEYDQLWILFDGFVVVYSDVVRQVRLYSPEVEKHLWGLGDLHIARGEYVSDMVVNSVLQRMYDNVNLVCRAMHSKLDYREKNGKTVTSVVGLSPVEYRKLRIAEKSDVLVPLDAPMTSESFNYCIRMIYRGIETLLSFVQDETVV